MSRLSARHVLVLGAVIGAHVLALAALLTAKYSSPVRVPDMVTPMIVLRLGAPAAPAPRAGRAPSVAPERRATAVPSSKSAVSAQATPPASGSNAIDWSAEAQAVAQRQIEADDRQRRQARAFSAPTSPMFAPAAPHAPEFGWDPTHTQRIEPLPDGGTLIHINDRCVLVIAGLIPLPACSFEKPPVRGDLFDHMHDPAVPANPDH